LKNGDAVVDKDLILIFQQYLLIMIK